MSVRPHPTKGGSWWHIDYYPSGRKGKRAVISFQGTEIEARDAERKLRMESSSAVTAKPFPRVAEVIPEFLTSYKLDHQPSGYDRMVRAIKILLPYFGRLQFSAITQQAIEFYKAERLKTVTKHSGQEKPIKPTTVQKELCALSSLCRWAEERGYCHRIKIKKFPAKLTRAPLPSIPSREEVTKVLESIPAGKRGPFMAMYYAGLRKTEACGLMAENVNVSAGLLIVTGKGNKERLVPLIEPLKSLVVDRAMEIGSGLLWPNEKGEPFGDLRLILHWACKRAGVKRKYTPHLFRHCFGTHGLMDGISLRGMQGILGHSTSTTTERYTHLAAEYLQQEMGKMETGVVKNKNSAT